VQETFKIEINSRIKQSALEKNYKGVDYCITDSYCYYIFSYMFILVFMGVENNWHFHYKSKNISKNTIKGGFVNELKETF
jgi:hypothetical protein